MSGEGEPIRRALGAITLTRLAGNTLTRFPYMFITAISRGLGIRLESTTAILGFRELGGLAAPAIGQLADRGHERRTMAGGAAIAGLATLSISLIHGPALFTVLLVVGGIAVPGFLTAQSAWIGHRVPFERQSRVFGVIELSWAGGLLIGVPICAWLESAFGWRAMFVFSGGSLLVAAALTWAVVPPDDTMYAADAARPTIDRALVGMYAYAVLQPFGQMFVFAVNGDWFVKHLGMSNGALAASTFVIGVGEAVGTGAVAVVSDRMGKRRAGIAGMAIAAPMALGLGLVHDTTGGAGRWVGVVLVATFAAGIEFSFVSALPLFVELAPDARARTLGTALALMTVSRAVASAVGGVVYVHGGMAASGVVGGTAMALAGGALWVGRER